MNNLLINKLLQTKNEKLLYKNIINFYGTNICEKCHESSKNKLIYGISFNVNKGNYKFMDYPNANYKLIKICDNCTYYKCSEQPIFTYTYPETQFFK